ncbi:TPA: EndoU domain-containing protein [Listeria innocua]|uniref:EndoU domain-containing protein n=1 Tax=Listeria innocua TaxID=1642 RepID=UPI0010EB68B2|nr:EndoU domain-containing protein [Listeria innocua]MBC2150119.1 EndoU domain-containing protein [Listeria innocua]MBC2236867.1 EndoU domain-containing protein [Listeria innocua]HBM4074200.1 EndoU domain-containing protein [Listeria innocua]
MAEQIYINDDTLENYKQDLFNRLNEAVNQFYRVDHLFKQMDDYLHDEGLANEFYFTYSSQSFKIDNLNEKLWNLTNNIVRIYREASEKIDSPFKKNMEQFAERLSLVDINRHSVSTSGIAVQGEAWQPGESISAPSTAYNTFKTKNDVDFMDLMNSSFTRKMKQEQYQTFLAMTGQLDFQINYETFVNTLYRQTDFNYETGLEKVTNMLTTGLVIVCVGGLVVATGGTFAGIAVPGWISTTSMVAGGIMSAQSIGHAITGLDINGNPLSQKEREAYILSAGTDIAFMVAGFGLSKILRKQANMLFINNLDETENIYQNSKYINGELRQGGAGHTYHGFAKTKGSIAGGHIEDTLSNEIKVIDTIPNPPVKNQPYKGIQQNLVSGEVMAEKTMFPKNWSVEKIDKAIQEAFQTKIYTGTRNQWIGETKSGMKLMFYLNAEGKIISAFPIID